MVYISLGSYLKKLKDEGKEPPSITALAEDIGLHKGSLNRIANNHVKQLRIETADLVIKAMRARGFNTGVADIIKFKTDAIKA